MLSPEREADLLILCDLFPADTVADSHLKITDLRQLLAANEQLRRAIEIMQLYCEAKKAGIVQSSHGRDQYNGYLQMREFLESLTAPEPPGELP